MSENVILDFKKLKLSPKEISFSYSSLVRHAIYYIELCLYRLSYKLYKKYSYGRLCPFMCPYDHDNIHEHIFWALKSTLVPPKIMSITPKRRSHSASLTFNVKKGIRCNYIPNMKALAQILMNKNANFPLNFNRTPTETPTPGRVVELSLFFE